MESSGWVGYNMHMILCRQGETNLVATEGGTKDGDSLGSSWMKNELSGNVGHDKD